MSFRTGSIRGRGIVYSRRRGRAGRGAISNNMFGDRPSIIYEESEEESDFELSRTATNAHEPKHGESLKATGAVLKDKSNIVRPPKQRSEQQVAPQIDNVRNHSQQMETRSGRRVANPTRATALVAPPARKQAKVTKPLPVITHPPSAEKSFVFDSLESEADYEVHLDNPTETRLSMVDIKSTLHPQGVNLNSKPPPKAAPRKGKVSRKSRKDSSDLKGQPSTPAKSTKRASPLAPVLSPQQADDQTPSNERTDLDTILDGSVSLTDDVMCPQTLEPIEEEEVPKRRKRKGKSQRAKASHVEDNGIPGNDTAKPIEIKMDCVRDDNLNTNTPTKPSQIGVNPTTPKPSEKIYGSSPPFSPPNIPIDQCFPSDDTRLEFMTPCPPSANRISADYITPSQPEDQQTQGPPGVRKPFNFWNSQSGPVEPDYVASPSPATDMRTEDFVVLRRKRGVLTESEGSDIIEHRRIEDKTKANPKPSQPNPWTKPKKGTKKPAEGTATKKDTEKDKAKVNKWVRFLDVGISCPSDESDDELAFCKPSWTNKTGKQQSEEQ